MNSLIPRNIDDFAAGLPTPSQPRLVLRMRNGNLAEAEDMVIDERPVALVYNGISHAVMMATPADLEEFALGFSLSEGIIRHAGECYGIEVESGPEGIAVQLQIASSAFMALKERRRSLAGRTGCGLCGVDSLDQVCRPLPAPAPRHPFHVASLQHALDGIGARQALTRETGAAHAAAWCGAGGELLLVREDVGRHNALDKVIGAMARTKTAPDGGFFLITSRVSFEMVQKALSAGAGALAGMSAPTLAAIELAEAAGMTLLAFARGGNFVCYSHPQRLVADRAAA